MQGLPCQGVTPTLCTQAITARDSMAKSLYSALFDWIVLRINHALLNKKDMEEAVSVSAPPPHHPVCSTKLCQGGQALSAPRPQWTARDFTSQGSCSQCQVPEPGARCSMILGAPLQVRTGPLFIRRRFRGNNRVAGVGRSAPDQ